MRMSHLMEGGRPRIIEQDSHLPTLEFLEDTAMEPYNIVIKPVKEYWVPDTPGTAYVLTITTSDWVPEPFGKHWWKLYAFPVIQGVGEREMIDYRREVRTNVGEFGSAEKLPPPPYEEVVHAIRHPPSRRRGRKRFKTDRYQ
jgi:hypothetical protein